MIHRISVLVCSLLIAVVAQAADDSDRVASVEARITIEIEYLIDATSDPSTDDLERASKYLRKGVAAHDGGDHEKALRHYGRVIEIAPTSADGYYERAYSLSQLGRIWPAFEDVSRAVLLDPKLEAAYLLKAALLDDLGLPERALLAYRSLLDINPDSYMGHLNYAITLMRSGAFDEAETALVTARDLQPAHPSAYFHLATLARDRGHNYDERSALEKFVEVGAKDARLPAVQARLKELQSHQIVLNPTSPTFIVDFLAQGRRALWKSDLHRVAFPDAGGYELSYEEEHEVITMVVESWRELKTENPEVEHDEYQMWTAIVDAGFLDEYIWYVNQAAFGETGSSWLKEHKTEIEAFLAWAAEAGFYKDSEETTTEVEEDTSGGLPFLVLSTATESNLVYTLNILPDPKPEKFFKKESKRLRKQLEFSGSDRITEREAKHIIDNPAALFGLPELLRALRVLDSESVYWERAMTLSRRFAVTPTGGLPPPNPLPLSIGSKKGEITIDLGEDLSPAWLSYAMAKAVFRHEDQLRLQYGAPAGGEPSVIEEVFAWTTLLQAYHNSLQAEPGEDPEKPDPYFDRLIEVDKSGDLHGFVLFEVIHRLYGVRLEALTKKQADAIYLYLRRYAFARVGGATSP